MNAEMVPAINQVVALFGLQWGRVRMNAEIWEFSGSG